MGMPEIVFTFETLAKTFVERSEKGVVALLLKDETEGDAVTKVTDITKVSTAFTADNLKHISAALDGGASAVLAVRVVMAEEDAKIEDTLSLIGRRKFDWLAYPEATTENTTAIVTWIKAKRKDGKTYKAVVGNATAPDCEGIVNFCTSDVVSTLYGEDKLTATAYSARIAGVLAGMSLDMGKSATYYELTDVSSVTESADPDADVDAGKLIIVYDGEKFKLGRAVTSMTTGEINDFKKIKHVEGADMLKRDIQEVFEDEYVGKVPNSYDNKMLLVAFRNGYLKDLQGTVLDPDFDSECEIDVETQKAYLEEMGVDTSAMKEIDILKANTDSAVFLTENIKLLDAMEDLTFKSVLN